jgi:cytochrome P450 family 142 subfamily A polypeptide 1
MTATDARPIDLLDPYLYSGDPWPVYRWLRNEAPAYRDVNGIVGVSRHADVSEVERNTELYSSASGSRPFIQMSASMINKDDPFHAQQRKLVSSRFRLAALARHEDHVRRVVTELIDAVAPTGRAEVVADLAAPLPAIMITDLMGYDRTVWPQVKWWSEATMAQAGYLDGDERRPRGSEEASADFAAETMKLMEARRAEPRDDLMSVWVQASLDGVPLPIEEIFNEALLLIDGGAETTRSTIGQTVVALSEHPEQRERIIRDPSVLRTTAVDEFIRWSSPILNMRRTVTAEHELHGQHLRAGDEVLLMYAAANRDERAFDRPDEFDVLRNHNHHVAFGFGPHRCLGANLALLELRVLFEELLRRLPDFRLAPGHRPEFVPGFFTRTYREVHIEFTPEP